MYNIHAIMYYNTVIFMDKFVVQYYAVGHDLCVQCGGKHSSCYTGASNSTDWLNKSCVLKFYHDWKLKIISNNHYYCSKFRSDCRLMFVSFKFVMTMICKMFSELSDSERE